MYDQCHCGAVKRKCTSVCQYCTGRKRRHVALRKTGFSDAWLCSDELRQIVLTEMEYRKLTILGLAEKTESDHEALSEFLAGRRTIPDKIAKHLGFRRANAWMRLEERKTA